METLNPVALAPLPDPSVALADAQLLHNYYTLYMHYFFGAPLPADFPAAIVKQFPSKAYKQQLKTAIANETNVVNGYLATQNEYLKDYYALYMHYAYSSDLPADFPQSILEQFPNKSYQQQLKGAIATLQNEINQEKAAM